VQKSRVFQDKDSNGGGLKYVSLFVCFSSFLSLHLQFHMFKLDIKGSEIHLNGALDSSNLNFVFLS
jgi:hypothetical protein